MKFLSIVLIVFLLLSGCLSEHDHSHTHTHGDDGHGHVHVEVESKVNGEEVVKETVKVQAHSHGDEHVEVKETVKVMVNGEGEKEIVKETVKVQTHSHDHGEHGHSHGHGDEEIVKEIVKVEVSDDGEKEIVKETITVETISHDDDGEKEIVKETVKETVKVQTHSHDHSDHDHSHDHGEKEVVKETVKVHSHSHSHNEKGHTHSHNHNDKPKASETKKEDFDIAKLVTKVVEKINEFVDLEKVDKKINEFVDTSKVVEKINEFVDFEKIVEIINNLVAKIIEFADYDKIVEEINKYVEMAKLVEKMNELLEKIESNDKVNELSDQVKDFDIHALFIKFKLDKDPKLAALVSTAFIGIVPIFIILIIPLGKREPGKPSAFLKSILAFAVGGLLGDTFLHLIPHSLEPLMSGHSHSHEGEHNHTELNEIGLLILSGMFAFFIIEKLATLNSGGGGHSHGKKKNKNENENKEKIQRLKVSALLNMIGDTIHNFTDGMAIAASFMASYKLGISTTIAVFFHEIPHEIGDMAILAQSGYGKISIMFIQLLTALGCVAGAFFSFVADELPFGSTEWMLPFIAGGFIYIATVDVIPTLFEKTTWKQTISEMFFMTLGVTLMLFITH